MLSSVIKGRIIRYPNANSSAKVQNKSAIKTANNVTKTRSVSTSSWSKVSVASYEQILNNFNNVGDARKGIVLGGKANEAEVVVAPKAPKKGIFSFDKNWRDVPLIRMAQVIGTAGFVLFGSWVYKGMFQKRSFSF
eukprot:TRINITY_DN541_c0_g1_i1.p1 TRINITY_DN541_c0_g1~~TRINITY_DN541_c0_g1_i1.p1  ORF type:complete len:136 (+),score=48.81 TRINITY_DN541_c0_g1_i1:78-485(+)